MPFTRSLLEKAIVFDLYDQSHHGRSSDAEFVILNSLHPPSGRPLISAFPDNDFFSLPKIFREAGYATDYAVPFRGSFWNARHMSAQYGFEQRYFKQDLPKIDNQDRMGWGMPDELLFATMLQELEEVPEPFFAYLVTLGSHYPFDELEPEQKQLRLPTKDFEETFANYLQCCRHRDDTLKQLVQKLTATSYGQNTVLVLVGDHDAGLVNRELLKYLERGYPWTDSVPAFIVHGTDLPGGRRRQLGAHSDLAPTLLHLYGLVDAKPVFLGWNLLAAKRESVVARSGYALHQDGYWVGLADNHDKISDEQKALLKNAQEELDFSQIILEADAIPELRR